MNTRDRALAIMKPFLGPAAQDMLDRTARTMLGLESDELQLVHVDSLAYWVRAGAAKLMSEARADELAAELRRID